MSERPRADNITLDQFETTMLRSQLDIEVLDANGVRLLSRTLKGETDRSFEKLAWSEGVEAISHSGCAYLRCEIPPVFALCMPLPRGGGIPGELFLSAALLESLAASNTNRFTATDMYKAAFNRQLDAMSLESHAREFGIAADAERCVVLFYTVDGHADVVERMLLTLFPETTGDAVVVLDAHSVALVKVLDDMVKLEEFDQLAKAIEDSVLTEVGVTLLVGIGEPSKSLSVIHESLAEARDAILIGRTFRPHERVFNYRSLLLERLLSEIEPSAAAKYHSALFTKKHQRLFSEDMLNTIDMFFACNLNLSEAARQLYIHRNTLVYRLDKFQRAVGLDLRTFEDAVTFRVLMMLRRIGEIHPAQVTHE